MKQLSLTLVLISFFNIVFSQSTDQIERALKDTSLQLLVTNNQDSLLGKVIEYQAPEIHYLFVTGDTLYFDGFEIRSLLPAPAPIPVPADSGKPSFSLYQDLFLSMSAFSLPAKRIQARNTQLIWNQVSVGATDHYSIGVGYVLPFSIVLKTKFASNNPESNYNMAAGANLFFSLLSNRDLPRGIHLYVASTIGSPDRYINFNGGYMVDLGGRDRAGLVSGGGLFPLAKKWNIILDNLLVLQRNNNQFYPGAGISYGHKKHRFDLGYFYFTTFSTRINNAPGIGYTLNF